jgi:hypothetical protein
MITDNDPGLVVQKFAEESTGLGQFLKSNPANWEIVSIDPSSDWELLLQQRARALSQRFYQNRSNFG